MDQAVKVGNKYMKPIRILHMIGSMNIGGSQIMMLNLYRAINRDVIQFDFILDHPEERALADQFEALGARIFAMPSFRLSNIADVKYAWDEFFKNHSEYKILHSHVRSYASIYIPIAKKYGLTTIIHSHSTSNGTGAKALLKAVLQYPLRYQADYFFGCSEEAGRWLFGKKVIQRENYKTIQNCVDIEHFTFSPEKREQIRRQFNIAPDVYVLGHVGRFHEVKNHRFLLDVFVEVLKKKKQARLMLVGDGELREDIRTCCAELGILDKVFFVGSKRDTAPFYSAMDCFVFPSLWEGVPVSVVEAQASGLPCVISDTITKDVFLLEDFVCAKSVEDPPEKWADQILAIRDGNARKLEKSKMQMLADFDSGKVAERLCNFYYEL